MSDEILRVPYFPSTSLKQIVEALQDIKAIVEVYGQRRYFPTRSTKKVTIDSELPFIFDKKTTLRTVEMSFFGRFRRGVKGEFGVFPTDKVFKLLEKEGVVDIQVNQIKLLCNNPYLWKELGGRSKAYPIRESEKSFILTFHYNTAIPQDTIIRRNVLRKMQYLVESLKFRPETLDLVFIQTYPDWKAGLKNNLFGIGWSKARLRELMCSVFKPSEPVYIKIYKRSETLRWELVGEEELGGD